MKKKSFKRIALLLTTTSMVASMASAINAAAEKTPEESLKEYNALYAHSREFIVDDAKFTKKYNDAFNSLNNDDKNYIDYQSIRESINELYKNDEFRNLSFDINNDNSQYNIDNDNNISYYDYCCLLRYIQEQLGLTEQYTDFTKNTDNERLSLDLGECSVSLKKLDSDKSVITLPSEICCKVKTKNEKNELVDAWCIMPLMQIEKNAFSECTNMTELTLRNYIQPKWFKQLGGYDCEDELYKGKLQPIQNGDEKTRFIDVADNTFIDIADGAFNGCTNLNTVNFQENINFSQAVFNGTAFAKSSDNFIKENGVFYIRSSDKKALVACGVAIGECMTYKDGIVNLNIMDGTTTIARNVAAAFYLPNKNTDVSLNLPSTIKYIHNGAFNPGIVKIYSQKINSSGEIESNNIYEKDINCSQLTYINGKKYDDLGRASAEQSNLSPQELKSALDAETAIKELLRKNNGSFRGTKLLVEPVEKIIDEQIAVINKRGVSSEKEKIEAVCEYIFKKADYTSYYDKTELFNLFPNGDYNTLDEARANINSAANAFLTDHTMCISFSLAVSLMLDKLEINNYILHCKGHAYNCVYIDDEWQLIDMSAYGDYDRKFDLYERSKNTSFIKKIKNVEKDTENDLYKLNPMQIWDLYEVPQSAHYPMSTIGGSSDLSVFDRKKMISFDVDYPIVGISDDHKCLTVALPANNDILPDSIKEDLEAGRIKKYEDDGIKKINKAFYYYKNNNMLSDTTEEVDGKNIWFFPSGQMYHSGWITINGEDYYFKDYNVLACDEKLTLKSVNGDALLFNFNKDCSVFKGLAVKGNYLCYLNGKYGIIKEGSQTINDIEYHFDSEGKLDNVKGWIDNKFYIKENGEAAHDEEIVINENGENVTYYFNANGEKSKGWCKVNNKYYYYDENYHKLSCAYIKWGNNYYHLDDDGVMTADDSFEWKYGKKLHADKDGALNVEEVLKGDDLNEFYNELTLWNIGWNEINGKYYLTNANLNKLKNAYVKLGDIYYHFDENGVMTADDDFEWKYGIMLHADENGALNVNNVLHYDYFREFTSELTAY